MHGIRISAGAHLGKKEDGEYEGQYRRNARSRVASSQDGGGIKLHGHLIESLSDSNVKSTLWHGKLSQAGGIARGGCPHS